MSTKTTLATLQEHIAHLTKDVQDLSDIVADQSKTITVLSRRLGLLLEAEAQRQAETGNVAIMGDERPPHY